jgi:hypothetical protein
VGYPKLRIYRGIIFIMKKSGHYKLEVQDDLGNRGGVKKD